MNFQIPRWLHVILMCVLAVAGVLAPIFNKGTDWEPTAGAALAMLMLVIHSVDPETAAKIVAKAAGAALLVLTFQLGVTGCALVKAAWPFVETIAQTILDDLKAADPASQIASDVCKDMGGSSATDAVCADVPIVVADVAELLMKDSQTPAEARQKLGALHPAFVVGRAQRLSLLHMTHDQWIASDRNRVVTRAEWHAATLVRFGAF